MRLLLWDVDGTLVRVGDAGRDPFQEAITAVMGLDLEVGFLDRVTMSGKTDPQIARELLVLAEVSDSDIEANLPDVLRVIEERLLAAEHRVLAEGRALPGAAEVLAGCSTAPGVVQSVLTGNLAGNAVVKLRAFGLDRWLDLDIGAYGSDHHDREELVAIALGKARAAHGDGFSPGDTWVIGDTPRDLACAKAGGAHCVLVATGRFSRDDLEGLGADVVLDDLRDTSSVVDVLVGGAV